MAHQTDVVVIGAGIAGLAAGVACRRNGFRVVVLDRGSHLESRNRNDPWDVASGVGGAGLFSDGKFSFFPSATQLWTLQPQSALLVAYDWFRTLVSRHYVDAPPFPLSLGNQTAASESSPFIEKNYDSQYMSLPSRVQMVTELANENGLTIETGTAVQKISFEETCRVDVFQKQSSHSATFEGKAIIVCTGRLGPMSLQSIFPSAPQAFRRLEIGVRIEQPSEKFFLRESASLDPKRIWTDTENRREWRTFCCCREGEVIPVVADGILSVSGRSDIPETGRSNIGFHLRLLDSAAAEAVWLDFRDRSEQLSGPISESMERFLNESAPSRLRNLLGPNLWPSLRFGLLRLLETFPDAATEATLLGPAIEGVVKYPVVSADLRIPSQPLWIAGDSCGLFRGITAAGVSGYFAGMRASEYVGALK